jgi:hypothetical protein
MTHSYQEFESREPIERGLGRAAMRVCPVARTELTPVNRSRSRACAARNSVSRACAGGIQVALRAHRSTALTRLNTQAAATENRRASRCRGGRSVRPLVVKFLSYKDEYFQASTSRSSAIRDDFGDVPPTLSHGGRRSLLDPVDCASAQAMRGRLSGTRFLCGTPMSSPTGSCRERGPERARAAGDVRDGRWDRHDGSPTSWYPGGRRLRRSCRGDLGPCLSPAPRIALVRRDTDMCTSEFRWEKR